MDQEQNYNKQPLDFSRIREVHERAHRGLLLKIFLWIAGALGGILLCFILLSIVYIPKTRAIVENGLQAKTALESAQHELINRDFVQGRQYIEVANTKLRRVQEDFSEIILIRWIPFVGSQVRAVDALLVSGVEMTSSAIPLLTLADDLTRDLKNESIPFSDISDEQKKVMLQKIVDAKPAFDQLKNAIATSQQQIEKIESKRLLQPLRDVITPLQQYLPTVRALVDQAVPLIDVLPQVVGFEETKTYLFLLQNNYELRPTGGFIGTYGILKLKNGAIQTLVTDNIYNLDRAFDDQVDYLTPQQTIDRPTPAPIERYLEQKQWALRDINWDPDFPTTANTAIEMYNLESVAARDVEKQIFDKDPKNKKKEFISRYIAEDFDGVFAMTPEVIEGLLKITGPIVVDGIRFTDENFQDELSFRVTYEYRDLIIEERSRKDIIRRVADQIKARILSLPYTRLINVSQVFLDSLLSKSILVYSNDEKLQTLITDRGWSGAIDSTALDYLYVVDSNLGSLKTDQFMSRKVNYEIEKRNGEYVAKATLTYKHNGEFAWNSTRLRSYTRVYIPQGAKLLKSSGEMYDDVTRNKENKPGTVDVYEEHGRTVLGAFISVEPREAHTLIYEYVLPQNIKESIEQGRYNLLVQKQPGTTRDLTVSLDFDKTIKSASPLGEIDGGIYTTNKTLFADSWFVVGL